MKYRLLTFFALLFSIPSFAQIGQSDMEKIYDEVKTPYKYGMVVAPTDNYHKIDCPMIFRCNNRWMMTYVVYDGKDGLDGRGYETWLATSDDLLHWETLGRVLAFPDTTTADGSKRWDRNQRAGYPALIDWTWNGSYELQGWKGRHWMSYFGGPGTGYEAVRAPLNIGLAWTKRDIGTPHQWQVSDSPILSIKDKDAQWWEKLTHYKSTVYWDKQKLLGSKFVMFYNAGGVNPDNKLKAERIGIALSDDMKHWKRYAGNPIFTHESPGIITGDAQIAKIGDLYVMFYFSAYNPSRRYNAFNTFAVSRDLVHWQDWNGADLIYPTKPYDEMFAHKSYVMKHNGVVYHFYCAVNNAGQRGIALATSAMMGTSDKHFPATEKKGVRDEMSLNDNWTTYLKDSLESKKRVNIPHNWDDYYGYRQLKHGNLHGTAVYEKDFEFSNSVSSKRNFLLLEGIGTYATVEINGKQFSRMPVGRVTQTLNVTNALKNGTNHIKITTDHPSMITDMPWVCGGCSSEWGFSEGSQPLGIFRPITLITTDEVRIEPFGVHVWNNESADSVFIETEIKNYGTQNASFELVSKLALASGKSVFRLTEKVNLNAGETKTIRQASKIENAKRWSPDEPYLYTLTSMIKRSGKTSDLVATPVGIRTLSWPVKRNDGDNRFYLNEKPLFINGTCEYEHLLGGSHAFSNEQIAARMKLTRNAGFNALREAHQPHNLEYQRLADLQGMLYWSQFSAHIWYDTPDFRNNFKTMLRQWIKERRNSPSVILWGLQNESVLPKEFAEECCQIIREMDPTARTMRAITTCNGGEGTDWNVVQNWSGTYGGDINKYDEELKRPEQLLNGEYGAWRTLGLHGENVKSSEDQFAKILLTKHRLALSARDSLCGHFQWLLVSHDNPGRTQPDGALRRCDKIGPINYKGLLTIWEQPTHTYYKYRQMSTSIDSVENVFPATTDDITRGEDGYDYLYRLNCGGDSYTDHYGQTWIQDSPKYAKSWGERFGMRHEQASQGHITDPIRGTSDDELFQFFRYGRHLLNYDFPIENGTYRVELYFTEPWHGRGCGQSFDGEGLRMFDVAINDSVVIRNLDPWAESNFAGACKKVVSANVTNGHLRITFPNTKVGQAVICAIAIAQKTGNHNNAYKQESSLAPGFWHSLDTDTCAVTPKELLPADTEEHPAERYTPTKTTKKSAEYEIKTGLGREYALRFSYKNLAGSAVKAEMTLTDAKGMTVVKRDISFPPTPNKFRILNTTTASQINAGTYKLRIRAEKDIETRWIEVQ